MIYRELTTQQMINDLTSDTYGAWTYEQAEALVDYLEEFASETDWEWDTVAIRCDYSGYDSRADAESQYDLDDGDELEDYTTVIECEDGQIVIHDF